MARTGKLLAMGLVCAYWIALGAAPGAGARDDPFGGDRAIVHVLNRLAFGPRPGDVERVRAIGLDAWIDAQLNPERVPEAGLASRLAPLSTLALSPRQLAEQYSLPAAAERRERQRDGVGAATAPGSTPTAGDARPAAPLPPAGVAVDSPARGARRGGDAAQREREALGELPQQKILRAVYGERQLEEVLVDFWFNHFNVFAGKGPTRLYVGEYERDVIRPRVLGRFRDLLGATATSPAMLFYLDNWLSVDPRASLPPGRTTAGRPGGAARSVPGQAAARRRGLNENYARELLELHTLGVDGGYTQQDIVEVARCFTGWTIDSPRQGGGFVFRQRLHDPGKKLVLGTEIKAGGQADGDRVLDLLARHPSTARHIATKLARRFVADDPPPTVVARAATRFRDTDGDIRAVVRTIVTSPEFLAADAYRAKVKSPFEFVVSALRATGAQVDDARPLVRSLRDLGMPLYLAQAPTGYADRAETWVNSGALLARMNFALALVATTLPGVRVELEALAGSEGPDAARGRLTGLLLGGDVSDPTRRTLARASDAGRIAALTLGAPEFQRR